MKRIQKEKEERMKAWNGQWVSLRFQLFLVFCLSFAETIETEKGNASNVRVEIQKGQKRALDFGRWR